MTGPKPSSFLAARRSWFHDLEHDAGYYGSLGAVVACLCMLATGFFMG